MRETNALAIQRHRHMLFLFSPLIPIDMNCASRATNRDCDPDVVRYTLDKEDRLVCIGPAWSRFAKENRAERLAELEMVLGEPIWRYIAGNEVREIHRMMFESVRISNRGIRFPYRCDAPAMRRFMELEISPEPDRGLSIVSRMLRSSVRPPVELLEATARDPNRLLRICSWCKRVQAPNARWMEVETAARELGLAGTNKLPRLTHGICPDCDQLMRCAMNSAAP